MARWLRAFPVLCVTLVLLGILPPVSPPAMEGGPPWALAAAGPASLDEPEDGANLTSLGPVLSWSNPPGTTQVHLQVVPINNDGPGVDLYFGFPQPEFSIPAPPTWYGLLPDMRYTWRVRVSDAPAVVDLTSDSWSPWAERSMRTPPVDSSTVRLVSPRNNGSVATLTPTLEWSNSRNDVFYYEVQVSKDRNFATDPAKAVAMVYWELRHGGVTSPPDSYTVPSGFPLESGARYYWRVRPRVQGDGRPVEWTAAASFVASAGDSPPPTPAPGATSTPVPGPSATPTRTATPPTGATATSTPTPAVTPTRTPTPAGGTTGERVVNGTFEGSGGWVDSCACITGEDSVPAGWHSGQRGARLQPAEGSDTASVYQVVTVPFGASSVILSYWYRLEGTGSTDNDCLVVGVSAGSQAVAKTERCVKADGFQTAWTRESIELTSAGGGSYFLTLGMKAASSRNHENYALVDDVSILVQ